MSSPKPESPPCPNLIFIAPALGQLDVIACQETQRNLTVLWHEHRSLPEQVLLQSRLAEICKSHALLPDTRVVLLAPPGTGGLFTRVAPHETCTEERWRLQQLELWVPYPSSEIRYQVRCDGDLAHFFWVPVTWLDYQQKLCEKLGLVLAEVYSRTALVENTRSLPGHEGVLCEKSEQGEYLYERTGGRISQALFVQSGTDSQVRQAYLGTMKHGGGETAVALPKELPGWQDCLFALWREPELAIPVNARPSSLWAPFFRIAMAVLLVTIGLAATLSWQIAVREEALTKMTRERKTLADPAKRFGVLERALRGNEASLAAIKRIGAAPSPLPLLAQFTAILPRKAWIQHMVFDGKSVVISGRGIGDDELISLLRSAGLPAEISREEPLEARNDFRLRIHEKHAPSAAAGGGAS